MTTKGFYNDVESIRKYAELGDILQVRSKPDIKYSIDSVMSFYVPFVSEMYALCGKEYTINSSILFSIKDGEDILIDTFCPGVSGQTYLSIDMFNLIKNQPKEKKMKYKLGGWVKLSEKEAEELSDLIFKFYEDVESKENSFFLTEKKKKEPKKNYKVMRGVKFADGSIVYTDSAINLTKEESLEKVMELIYAETNPNVIYCNVKMCKKEDKYDVWFDSVIIGDGPIISNLTKKEAEDFIAKRAREYSNSEEDYILVKHHENKS